MLTILGPTASGKTEIAVQAAHQLDGEVLSADSRQVYRGMDLGTGKDLDDYLIGNQKIPYHLIDIVDAGYEYNVYEYQKDFLSAYNQLTKRNKFPVLCGGSGMYLEAVLKNYKLIQIPPDPDLRSKLEEQELDSLIEHLQSFRSKLHNTTDIINKRRAIRAIEIESYLTAHPDLSTDFPKISSLIVGINYDRLTRRKRITQRLKARLENGMVEEVETLLNNGLKPEQLTYYGLEYKYLTLYLTNHFSYEEMFSALEIAIHQFAKRQMTWFRRMERQGISIHWLDGHLPLEEKLTHIHEWLRAPSGETDH